MESAVTQFTIPIAIIAVIIFIIAGLLWLFLDHGIDKLKHPKEWQTKGSSGEQIIYTELIKKYHIPENQILRNVYIPTKNNKTTEIDLLVVSKKGLLVFECKNYSGNIYGDIKQKKWLQYVGNKKSYFYNPFLQNQSHIKHLQDFLQKDDIKVPTISLIARIASGNWKIKNLSSTDYFLGVNCHLKDVYEKLPESKEIAKHYKSILAKLTPLSRPSQDIQDKHIKDIKHS